MKDMKAMMEMEIRDMKDSNLGMYIFNSLFSSIFRDLKPILEEYASSHIDILVDAAIDEKVFSTRAPRIAPALPLYTAAMRAINE